MRTLASDPSTRASPLQSAARTGSCTVAFIRRGVPLPSVSGLRSLAGRMVLPSVRPAALMGFLPFAVLIPPRVSRHFCRPGPTCRSRHAPAPIDFRRGDSKRPVAITWEAKVGRSGSGADGDRLLGFAPVCGARPRLSMAAGRDPALGFASCRVVGTRFAHPSGHVTGSDHQPPCSSVHARLHHPLMGFGESFPNQTRRRAATVPRLDRDGLPPPTSPALQRFEGADALPLRANFRPQRLPV